MFCRFRRRGDSGRARTMLFLLLEMTLHLQNSCSAPRLLRRWAAPCRFCTAKLHQPLCVGQGGLQIHREAVAMTLLVLRGGSEDAGASNSSEVGRNSWKDLVSSETRVPFEIMGSPLLEDAEIERIHRLRREQRGAALEPVQRPEDNDLFAQPRVETGPNGTYGPPDLTGRRWRSVNLAEDKKFSCPRVQLRYRVNRTQAEGDANLRTLPQNETADGAFAEEVQEEFPDDGTVDGFFNWYAQNKEKHYEDFQKYFPVPNLTLAPFSVDQPSGYVLDYFEVSRNFRLQSCKADDSKVLATDSIVACGDNRWGQLGLGYESSEPHYGSIPPWFRGGVRTGYNNSGMPNDHWGGASAGAIHVPLPVPAFRDRQVLALAAGWNHLICVTQRQESGEGDLGTNLGSQEPTRSKCTAATEVWGWGHNLFGQLGLGHRVERVTQPCIIEALSGLDIKAVACGQGHTIVLLRDGKVRACGDNSYGQLGLSGWDCREYEGDVGQTLRNSATAALISTAPARCEGAEGGSFQDSHEGDDTWTEAERQRILDDALEGQAEGEAGWGENLWEGRMNVTEPVLLSDLPAVRQVACGDYHTLMLTDDGTVLTCGANCCGQLGLGSVDPSDVPRVVESLAGVHVVSVACGSEHSVAAARGGAVWAWGRNIHGQLGNMEHPLHLRPPAYPRQLSPVLMVFQPAVSGLEVQQVACGRDHTVILFEDGQVWGCGHNFKFQLGIEHGQNAYYATCLSPVWTRWILGWIDQEQQVPPDEPDVMSVEEYTRLVSAGQKRFDMRKQELGEQAYFVKDDALQEADLRRQSQAKVPRVVEIACGEEHTVALLDNDYVVF